MSKLTGLVTIASGKGGVGKTTIALGVASTLARLGETVVLGDGDYGASATIAYGYHPDREGILPAILDGAAMEDALNDAEPGVQLVPGGPALANIPTDRIGKWILRLKALAREHLIVMDTSDDIFSAVVASAILASDILVVVTVPASKTYARTFPEIGGLLESANPRPDVLWAANMVDKRPTIVRHQLDQMARDGVILTAMIPRAIAVDEADAYNTSVVTREPKSKVSQAIIDLGNAIYARLRTRNGVATTPTQALRQPKSL